MSDDPAITGDEVRDVRGGQCAAVTLTWVGGALAIIGGALWIIAALISPGDVVWPIIAAALSVGTIVIAGSLGSRAGFWGWLAVRGFAVGVAGLVSAAFALLAAMGIVALAQSALLFARAPGRRLFSGSAVLALGFAVVGVAGYSRSQGTLPGTLPVLVFVALSALLVFVSLVGARMRISGSRLATRR